MADLVAEGGGSRQKGIHILKVTRFRLNFPPSKPFLGHPCIARGWIFSTGVIFFTGVYIFDRGLYFSLIEITFQPIVYGNVSKYFGKKREEDGHTHQVISY